MIRTTYYERTTQGFRLISGLVEEYYIKNERIKIGFKVIRNKGWKITHIDSGLKIAEVHGTKADAINYFYKNASCIYNMIKTPPVQEAITQLDDYRRNKDVSED